MRRKIYLAAILAAVMALQAPVMALAEGEPIDISTWFRDEPGEDESDDGDESGEWIINGDVTITDDSWSSTDPEIDDNSNQNVSAWGEGQVTTVNGDVHSTVSKETTDAGTENTYLHQAIDAGDGGTVNVNGSVSSENSGAIIASGGTVNVTGNVASGAEDEGQCAIFAGNSETGASGIVNVGGDVVSENRGAIVAEGGTVNVIGNVTSGATEDSAIFAGNSGTVEIGGDVISENAMAINTMSDANVSVKGDVTAQSTTAIEAVNSSDVTISVGGDVISESEDASAIVLDSNINISVGGDVISANGVQINLVEGGDGKVEILGTVTATGDEASAIAILAEGDIENIPKIVVGNFEDQTEGDGLWIGIASAETDDEGNTMYTDASEEVFETVYKQILYYIAQDKFANATLNVSGATKYANGWTSNEGNSLEVTIAAVDGYEVSNVSGTDVVKNADGTYTVVVQRGKGIDINAVISAIVKARKDVASSDSSAIVIPAYAAAQKQFQTAVTAQLKTLPAGGTLKLEMKDFISFNKKTFEVLSQRNDIDTEITYTWQGKKYRVVIPAGYDILSLLDKNGYCGCLYLNSIFGSTEITK